MLRWYHKFALFMMVEIQSFNWLLLDLFQTKLAWLLQLISLAMWDIQNGNNWNAILPLPHGLPGFLGLANEFTTTNKSTTLRDATWLILDLRPIFLIEQPSSWWIGMPVSFRVPCFLQVSPHCDEKFLKHRLLVGQPRERLSSVVRTVILTKQQDGWYTD